jgi:NADH-quinone oxidoreductase subunit M
VILAAVYLLHMFEKVFLGPVTHEENRNLHDLNVREIATLIPLLVLIFWIGIYPQPFFALVTPTVDKLVAIIQTASLALH